LTTIMLVALARKLIIALWRYVETGLVPDGAEIGGQKRALRPPRPPHRKASPLLRRAAVGRERGRPR
jgi:hypothetical protein